MQSGFTFPKAIFDYMGWQRGVNLGQVSDEVGRECGNRTWETKWAVIEKLNKRRKLGVERKRLKNENENKIK